MKDLMSRVLPEAAASSDPERGFRLLDKFFPDKTGSDFLNSIDRIYMAWTDRAPEAAAARALAKGDETERARAVVAVALGWKDRDAAIAWLEELPDPILATNALARLGFTIAQEDPVKGMDLMASIPQTDTTRQELRSTVSRWAWLDIHSAVGWVAALDNPVLARTLFAEIGLRKQPEEIERVLVTLPAEKRTQAEQWWRESNAPAPPAAKTRP